jgi:CRP/FNR family transcriptional regulator, cyclic AMP receptor protein
VAILEEDPELGRDLDPEQFEAARARLKARAFSVDPGFWPLGPDRFQGTAAVGLLIIDGTLVRGVTVGDYTCAELLGPGDLLQPWLRVGPEDSVSAEVDWEVVEALAPWPEITAALSRRIMQRAHWLAFHLAVCGLRRVEERILVSLWHFADRWGTVTPDGVRLDLRLTHQILAAVTGARRPSVSTAVRHLIDAGRVRPLPRSRWLLLGGPPAELRRLHERPRIGAAQSPGHSALER